MNTLYHKFLTRLRQINHHMYPGETALEAMARNMVEIVGAEFAELNTTILQLIATKLDTPPTAQDGYTPALCEVVKLANLEAQRVDSTTIEAHHLLIAIAQEGTSTPAKFIQEYLNINTQRLSGYAYEWHPFRDPSLASAKDIFTVARHAAQRRLAHPTERLYDPDNPDQDPVDVHHLFATLITIGNIQPNEICGLLSYTSSSTTARRAALSDQIPTAYQVYANTR